MEAEQGSIDWRNGDMSESTLEVPLYKQAPLPKALYGRDGIFDRAI